MSAEWSADFVHVALNLPRHALALMSRMIIVTTRTKIHGGDEHEGARKRDGVFAREMVICLSSKGWRRVSSAERENSGSSSRKRTPLCARLISPG